MLLSKQLAVQELRENFTRWLNGVKALAIASVENDPMASNEVDAATCQSLKREFLRVVTAHDDVSGGDDLSSVGGEQTVYFHAVWKSDMARPFLWYFTLMK